MKSRFGLAFVVVGLMLGAAGLAYGFAGVNVDASGSCGNAFGSSNTAAFTDTGIDACAAARSERKPMTFALIAAGVVGLAFGLIVTFTEDLEAKAAAKRLVAVKSPPVGDEQAPVRAGPNYIPPVLPGMYGQKN